MSRFHLFLDRSGFVVGNWLFKTSLALKPVHQKKQLFPPILHARQVKKTEIVDNSQFAVNIPLVCALDEHKPVSLQREILSPPLKGD
ncbi:MAG: hypothetical protein DWQ05_16400 [Calditrichaeota bacterium]|nr:MAG: hypothetical protein DWQ05_16400 [Calditrichota bacterium]